MRRPPFECYMKRGSIVTRCPSGGGCDAGSTCKFFPACPRGRDSDDYGNCVCRMGTVCTSLGGNGPRPCKMADGSMVAGGLLTDSVNGYHRTQYGYSRCGPPPAIPQAPVSGLPISDGLPVIEGLSERQQGTIESAATEATQQGALLNVLTSTVLSIITCPITDAVMKDPVIAADGYTYERSAIENHLASTAVSPKTGERMSHRNVVRNQFVWNLIGSFIGRHPEDA